MNEIRLGTRVSWRSQAGGRWTTKEGILIYKAPSITHVRLMLHQVLKDADAWASPQWREQIDQASSGQKEFYYVGEVIVAVDRRIKSDGTVQTFSKPRFYSPRAKLEVVFSLLDESTGLGSTQ